MKNIGIAVTRGAVLAIFAGTLAACSSIPRNALREASGSIETRRVTPLQIRVADPAVIREAVTTSGPSVAAHDSAATASEHRATTMLRHEAMTMRHEHRLHGH